MAKILLVEDDPLLSKMYGQIITHAGHEFELAEDGEEGLAKAQSIQPNLILMDIMMPKMNGLQVLKSLKGNEKTKHIPTVILTNLAQVNDGTDVTEAGAIAYIDKSKFEPRQVVELINQVLAQSAQPAQQVQAASPSPAPQQETPPTAQQAVQQPSQPSEEQK